MVGSVPWSAAAPVQASPSGLLLPERRLLRGGSASPVSRSMLARGQPARPEHMRKQAYLARPVSAPAGCRQLTSPNSVHMQKLSSDNLRQARRMNLDTRHLNLRWTVIGELRSEISRLQSALRSCDQAQRGADQTVRTEPTEPTGGSTRGWQLGGHELGPWANASVSQAHQCHSPARRYPAAAAASRGGRALSASPGGRPSGGGGGSGGGGSGVSAGGGRTLEELIGSTAATAATGVLKPPTKRRGRGKASGGGGGGAAAVKPTAGTVFEPESLVAAAGVGSERKLSSASRDRTAAAASGGLAAAAPGTRSRANCSANPPSLSVHPWATKLPPTELAGWTM